MAYEDDYKPLVSRKQESFEYSHTVGQDRQPKDFTRLTVSTIKREGKTPVFIVNERQDSEVPINKEVTDKLAKRLYSHHPEISHPGQMAYFEIDKNERVQRVIFGTPNRDEFPEKDEWRELKREGANKVDIDNEIGKGLSDLPEPEHLIDLAQEVLTKPEKVKDEPKADYDLGKESLFDKTKTHTRDR